MNLKHFIYSTSWNPPSAEHSLHSFHYESEAESVKVKTRVEKPLVNFFKLVKLRFLLRSDDIL